MDPSLLDTPLRRDNAALRAWGRELCRCSQEVLRYRASLDCGAPRKAAVPCELSPVPSEVYDHLQRHVALSLVSTVRAQWLLRGAFPDAPAGLLAGLLTDIDRQLGAASALITEWIVLPEAN